MSSRPFSISPWALYHTLSCYRCSSLLLSAPSPGLNNNFHVKVQSYLATLYNNRSILENHHCAEVFELMKNPRLNILGGMTDSQRRDIRETIIEMVLWTDMGLHAKIFGQWKRRISQDHDLYKRKDDQRLVLSMAIKMADINNCGRPENLYLKWTTKLSEEFFLQVLSPSLPGALHSSTFSGSVFFRNLIDKHPFKNAWLVRGKARACGNLPTAVHGEPTAVN